MINMALIEDITVQLVISILAGGAEPWVKVGVAAGDEGEWLGSDDGILLKLLSLW